MALRHGMATCWAELVQSDPHELQGVGVHDVEAAASVQEHLGEASVADDGVDNKRVPSRVWDVVGVVLGPKEMVSFDQSR